MQLVACLFIILALHVASALTPDGMALMEFKAEVIDNKKALNNWVPRDEDPCSWTGITCDHVTKRVISLNLPYMGLDGILSPSLGKLQMLQRLALHDNKLHGLIPAAISNCSELRALYLRNNFLSGEIPSRLGKVSTLMILDLSGNSLTGHIPRSLGQLSRLKSLNLSRNFLSGEIPKTGSLKKFGNSSYMDNVKLCERMADNSCKGGLGFPVVLPHSEIPSDNTVLSIPVPRKSSKPFSNGIFIGSMVVIGVILLVIMFFLWFCFLHKANKLARHYKKMGQEFKLQSDSKPESFLGDLPYTPKQIIKKVAMLGDRHIIGSGGFGTVYKLAMTDGKTYAVKRIPRNKSLSDPQLTVELEALRSIKHKNLASLHGYCNSQPAIFLIYDLFPMGNLDKLLHGNKISKAYLDWITRVKIAIGAARGLAYLHHDCCPSIVHSDLKTSNILLDDNMESHVSDYGLGKLLDDKESHVTTIVAGTFGYMAPEYLQCGRASEKCDVYSFGVILLELFSGKCPTEHTFATEGPNVIRRIKHVLKEGNPEAIIDPDGYSSQRESMAAVLKIILKCIAPFPTERPTMKQVVQMLQSDTISDSPFSL